MDAGRADNKLGEQDAHCMSSSDAKHAAREGCRQMYVEDPRTSLRTRPPTVLAERLTTWLEGE
jgi:hypothetical protein